MTHWVYFGTGASHLYVSPFEASSGELGPAREAAAIGRPGFLAVHPREPVLYAVGREAGPDEGFAGFAAAFGIERDTGSLRELNRAPTAGRGASHVAVNAGATALVAVNYGDGNTVSLSLEPSCRLGAPVSDMAHSGSSVHPKRQTQPHPHSANFSPDGGWVFVPDLGTDEIVQYSIDAESARLELRPEPPLRMAPGSGPRHMAFHANGRWAYVINELASTVTVLHYDASQGSLDARQTVGTLPEGYDGPANTTAEVLVHPNGRFLYGSNRGSNSIAVFAIEPSEGQLTAAGLFPTGGDWPRNFRLSPDGRFLLVANQRSDEVRTFRVDAGTGALEPTGAVVQVPDPMCVRFVPAS